MHQTGRGNQRYFGVKTLGYAAQSVFSLRIRFPHGSVGSISTGGTILSHNRAYVLSPFEVIIDRERVECVVERPYRSTKPFFSEATEMASYRFPTIGKRAS
jgi:hypothetical protein